MTERRQRRTPEQMIADLEVKIASVKSRAQRQKAKAHPATRLAIVAVKTIDKALVAAPNNPMKGALQEARTTLSAAVAVEGVVLAPSAGTALPRKRRSRVPAVAAS
jgi:hypothetical protein